MRPHAVGLAVAVVALNATALLLFFLAPAPRPALPPAPAPSASAATAPTPSSSFDDQRAQWQREHEQWMRRRNLEFTRCAQMKGTPTLGFNASVVCLNSDVVHFVGEPAPTYPELKTHP